MGPGFHRLYAQRLAWRYRLLLALGLTLIGFLYPPLALLSPLSFLLPARLFERQALQTLARASLAYPTALAYGEERLWREAERVSVPLPPFPLGLLLGYLLALVLLLVLLAWGPGGTPWAPWRPPQTERPLTPRPSEKQGPEGVAERGEGQAEGTPQEGATPAPGQPQEAQAPSKAPEASEKGTAEAQSPKAPGEEGTPAPGSRAGAGGQEAPPGGVRTSPPPTGAQGDGAGLNPKAPETSSPGPEVGKGSLDLPPIPSRPGQGLLEPGQGGEAPDLPSPWEEGRPPEGVRRGVEVYLERTPLPPEARELLRRYFSGP